MKHERCVCFFSVLFLSAFYYAPCSGDSRHADICSYVNPFIGTTAKCMGHTTPAAAWPFGMVQAAPVTGRDSGRYSAQYNHEDEYFFGFTQNVLAGTGVPDLGDVLILPVSGEKESYRLKADKTSERAEPGYYAISFAEEGIAVEAAVSKRSAIYSVDYFGATGAALYLDLRWGCGGGALESRVEECEIRFSDDGLVSGKMKVRGWVGREVFFAMRTSCPFSRRRIADAGCKGERWLLTFDGSPRNVFVKTSLSATSETGARHNLDTEIPDWDFARVRQAGRMEWNSLLSRITVEGSDEDKIKFYTALYRAFVQPNNLGDVGRNFYSTFSLWDTYRAAHPLYTIAIPEKVPDFVNSMLDQYDSLGHLPMWGLWGKDAECMLGIHSVSVIADALLKGFRGFDAERAYEAVRTTQRITHILPKGKRRRFFHLRDEWEVLDRYGYYPFDVIQGESVSRVMENSYDDWCAAQMAKALGRSEDAAFFANRCRAYRNIFDKSTGMMRGRNAAGDWRNPFDPYEVGHSSEPSTGMNDYTEGNAYQWTWHVLHDPADLMVLMGGAEKFKARLIEFFDLPEVVRGPCCTQDVTGLIGQYAHGNEPSHHVIYLFDLTDEPWRGQELVRRVCSTMYANTPDGLPGNEDCGQMSAWYVFSAIGFYPVSPASGEYWIGAPQVPKAVLKMEGRDFVVLAVNLSAENKYVKSVTLNGKPLAGYILRHADIVSGGELVFDMTSNPVDFKSSCSRDSLRMCRQMCR